MVQSQQHRPRQDPVSCESCRKKKLKCTRQHPCTNCTSRHILCEFKLPLPVTPLRDNDDDVASLRSENVAIKVRLEKLEQIIYQRDDMDASRPAKARRLTYGRQASNELPSPTTTSNASDSVAAELARNYRGDFRWLEGVGSHENTRLRRLAQPLVTRIASLEAIIDAASAGFSDERSILLPPFEQTMKFINIYIEQVDPVQHITHGPTVKLDIRRLFDRLEQGCSVEPNQTVLVLSMLASVASFAGLENWTKDLFPDQSSAFKAGMLWLRRTLDVLEYVRRSTSATLETVQSSVIAVFFVFHMEGFSPKARAMHFAALAAAKDLGMHRVDDPSITSACPHFQSNEVDKEMKRRIWWHLAATDWSMATLGSSHEATYNINPNQMRVNLPRNVTDEELETMPADFQHPASEPTTAAYALQRIRIGEICREIADLRWSADSDEVSVNDIKNLDAKFEDLFRNLPPFLRMDRSSRIPYADLEVRYPILKMQRYAINLIVHARRSKFHLPFLLRASFDPDYSFSREACLRAARIVIQIREELLREPPSVWLGNAKLCGVVHMFFYATVVLVMDLCINKGSDCDGARKREIKEACQALEEAKRQSPAAGMFLDSLMVILRKHKIKLQGQDQQLNQGNEAMTASVVGEFAPGGRSICPRDESAAASQAYLVEDDQLGDLWQSYINMEPAFDWDGLINDIEAMQGDGPLGLDLTAL